MFIGRLITLASMEGNPPYSRSLLLLVPSFRNGVNQGDSWELYKDVGGYDEIPGEILLLLQVGR